MSETRKVRHPEHGVGEVVRPVRGGRYLVVRFQDLPIPWQVSAGEVEWENPPQPDRVCERPAPPPLDAEALKLLEALRVGVVPSEGVPLYTVGRDTEMAMVTNDLDQALESGAARVILGDYGTGKTHMLECIETMALERGFVVSRVVLDDEEVSPSHPKRVYRSVVQGLRYPRNAWGHGLEPLFNALCEQDLGRFLKPGSDLYHRYLSPVLAHYRELKDLPEERSLLETTVDWIEGHPTLSNQDLDKQLRKATGLRGHRLYALMDYRPWAHLYSYLLGGVAWMVRQAGHRGLVILFDEAEFYSLLSSAGKEFADVLFGYYAAAALGAGGVHFDVDEAPRGGHAVHRAFPPLYQEKQNIYCVFAMTSDPDGTSALERILDPSRFACLSPLRLEDYQELCRRVITIYQRAYPDLEVGAQVQNPMGEVVFQGVTSGAFENPRQVLKFVMELLDFSRLRRDRIPGYIKEVLSYIR